jgi:hypothetical protein
MSNDARLANFPRSQVTGPNLRENITYKFMNRYIKVVRRLRKVRHLIAICWTLMKLRGHQQIADYVTTAAL